MILDCDACLVRAQDKPRYSRSKVGLSEVNGVAYIVLINSKTKEKFKVTNVKRLFDSSIAFKNPEVNLIIKNADLIMLKLLFKHLKKLVNGEKVPKLPDFDKIKNEKPTITSLYQTGNHFDTNLLRTARLKKVTIEQATRTLPKEIWNLRDLTELNLINCNLEYLPKQLIKLGKTLKLLNLSNNKLTKIDKMFFSQMPNLVSINLSNNHIKFIPLDIVLCRNLVSIDLNNNQLSNLPYTIIYLKKLAELNVSSNQIELFSSSIWTSIGSKLKLNKLNISNNYSIEKINQSLTENKKFTDFKIPTLKQLTSNSVTRKPQLFCNLRDYLPLFMNDEIEQGTDLCFECRKPYTAVTTYFNSIHPFPTCDLASGLVVTEEPSIWLCKNLCPICKFNSKFKEFDSFRYL